MTEELVRFAKGGRGVGGAGGRVSFTTTFTTNENPISDSARFAKSANWWADVRTGGNGRAWGLNGPNDAFDDAYALIVGATGNYELEGTVYRDAALNDAVSHEIELNFNFDETGGTGGGVRGFEFLFARNGQVEAFIWNHAASGAVSGSFSNLNLTGTLTKGSNLITGDVIKARKVGNVYTVFVNDVQLGTCTNSTYTDGQAAIAYFTRPGGTSAHLCLTQLKVTPL